MKNKICMIICYWGAWPKWFSFFIKSCEYNSEITWIFFSEKENTSKSYKNIRFFELTMNDFSSIASSKLNLKVNLRNPYKICDFRPTYGIIFEDYLKEFDFWGYCDIDIIFGNIRKFITAKILTDYDVISSYKGFFSGPFCLFKNKNYTNLLYEQITSYKQMLISPKYMGIDENIIRNERIGISFDKFLIAIIFLTNYLKKRKFNNITLKELQYQFQWFYKKLKIKSKDLADISEVIFYFTRKNELKSYFKEMIISDKHYDRIQKNNWKLIWERGELIEVSSGQKLMGFHFIGSKNYASFLIPEKINHPEKFYLTKNGFIFD